jgi:hypothetical protein
MVGEPVDGFLKRFGVQKQWGDIFELDPWFRKVRDISDVVIEIHLGASTHLGPSSLQSIFRKPVADVVHSHSIVAGGLELMS